MSREDETPSRDGRKPSIPAPATVPRPSRPPSAPPSAQGGRKATLDGVAPHVAGYAYVEPTHSEDFDSERTVVVDQSDHEDGPTADYDPRVVGYDPRARGVFPPASPSTPMPPRVELEARPSETGRKRNSRRTVKLVDPKKSGATAEAVADGPNDATLTPVLPEVVEAEAHTTRGAAQEQPFSELPDFSDAVADEITVVRALRIINVGNEPPPPFKSAQVTWPPPPDHSEVDTGWTPIAPPVADYPPPGDYASAPMPEVPAAPVFSPSVEARVPSAPDIPVITEDVPPLIELDSDRIGDERDDLIEDIEPDSLPLPDEPLHTPKKPPPPPPKARPEPKAVTELPKKGKPWWEDIFSEEYLRTHDRPDELTVQREVNFIEESLGMEKHAVVLDLACGAGDHTIDFALRGYNVMGLDYSAGQLALAEQRLKNRTRAITAPTVPTFVQGDMRELAYEEAFDGVYCWGTSFGYFDEEKNLAVLQNVHRSLKQGGMFLLDVVNRDYVASRAPGLVWFEGDRCVCMDDTYLDFFTSRLRVKRTAMFEGGLSRELDYSIRLYTLHELGKMLHEAGFKVIEVTGLTAHPGVFFGTESPRIIVLAERA